MAKGTFDQRVQVYQVRDQRPGRFGSCRHRLHRVQWKWISTRRWTLIVRPLASDPTNFIEVWVTDGHNGDTSSLGSGNEVKGCEQPFQPTSETLASCEFGVADVGDPDFLGSLGGDIAQFFVPRGITIDAFNNIYVADQREQPLAEDLARRAKNRRPHRRPPRRSRIRPRKRRPKPAHPR